MNKSVVIGAHFHWHSFLQIGSHQYAKQFAKNGYKVAYLSEFISPLHYIFAKDRAFLKEKCRSWYKGGEWVEEGEYLGICTIHSSTDTKPTYFKKPMDY